MTARSLPAARVRDGYTLIDKIQDVTCRLELQAMRTAVQHRGEETEEIAQAFTLRDVELRRG